jgi:signal transduction histidine kinase
VTRPTLRFSVERAAFAATAAGILSVVTWARRLDLPLLLIAGLGATVAGALVLRTRKPGNGHWLTGAILVLAIALAAAIQASVGFRRIEHDWESVSADQQRARQSRLETLMATRTDRAREAARNAAVAAEQGGPHLFDRLADIRAATHVDAIAVFATGGSLVAWSGDHRGTVPDEVRQGTRGAYFAERPLYSYLYISVPVENGYYHHAVAAILIESALVRPGNPGGPTTFVAGTRLPAIFRSGPGRPGTAAWSLVDEGDTVVHARLDPVTPAEVRSRAESRADRIVVSLALLALILASIGWLRRADVHGASVASMAPLVVSAIVVAVAPVGEIAGITGRASSLAFLLPVPGVSLGDVIAVLVALVAIAATLRSRRLPDRRWRPGIVAAAALVGLAYSLVLRSLIGMATPSLLEGGNALWLGIQAVATLSLTAITALLLPSRRTSTGLHIVPLVGAISLAAGLAVIAQAWAYSVRSPMPWIALAWGLPVLLVGIATASSRGPAQRIGRWLAIGFVAATAVVPQLWGAATDARLRNAERELSTFGAATPPIIYYQLSAFAREVRQRYEAGEGGAQLLYRSWVASGLAQEPYPVRITLWPAGRPPFALGLGGAEGHDSDSPEIRDLVQRAAQLDSPTISAIPGYVNTSMLLTTPLDSQLTVSVSVQPRRSLQRIGIIEPFLGGTTESDAGVNLVPATQSSPASDSILWTRSPDGWRSESRVWYPSGWYHAHMVVRFTPVHMRIARATLLVTFDLALLFVLFALGHAARGLRLGRAGTVRNWMRSFQARVTLALFVFFLVPTIVFGWLAYGGLSTVVQQAAGAVAARAARQAVAEWPQGGGDLRQLSQHGGVDVLYYLGGELVEASSPEAKELGVYGAWMREDTYRQLAGGEETTAREISELEGQRYLTAYEVMRPSGVLAVPVPLSVGDTASRQRDIADLTLLAAVLGLLLSGALAFAVGRTLAGPIGQLRRAATAVGAGRLSVRLPEPPGEFGQLFASFNRMTRRLRRARAQEVRTARVLAWGEMAQQIAHEIKNPLTPIKLAVQHLRRAFRDGRTDFGKILDENVEQILTEINRLTEISRAFSRYGAPVEQTGELARVNVSAIVHEAITLYRAGDTSVNYREELESAELLVHARTEELREVLMNLLENARDAVGAEGTVTVSARQRDGRVELVVADDGSGIAPDLLPRIFDPHFSTRSSGTGLGLAIVRRLVEGWGGTVEVASRPGDGTRFDIAIPAAGDGAEPD